MSITNVGGMGHAPTVHIKPYNPEAKRYERMWQEDTYRQVSPGEQIALTFLQQARAEKDAEVIDFGCGTGRGGLMLALLGAMKVTLLDFASNCLDPEVRQACETQPDRIKFYVADLTQSIPYNAAYGYCCDVMEHIPPEDVDKVLRNILASAQHVFFSISTAPDLHGPATLGEPLHLTVQPMAWWLSRLNKLGAVIHWSMEQEGACAIYCSAWKDAADLIQGGRINTDIKIVDQQIAANINAGWKHAQPFDKQNREVILLAGGPSMNDCVDTIKELRAAGRALVTVNGAYHWALQHGLEPSAQIVLDAREFNARFTKPVTEYTKYLVASQAHPKTLEGLPHDRTYLWHSALSEENENLVREKTGYYFAVPGGSTVVLRALPLLRMLGFWRFHMFGFDSCVKADAHHAYSQPENDNEPLLPVTCGGKTFECTPWMLSQASEFRDMVQLLGDEVELEVYGDGLIRQIIVTGASFSSNEKEH